MNASSRTPPCWPNNCLPVTGTLINCRQREYVSQKAVWQVLDAELPGGRLWRRIAGPAPRRAAGAGNRSRRGAEPLPHFRALQIGLSNKVTAYKRAEQK